MIKNIDHIAIKVSDLATVCQSLKKLGLICDNIEQYKEVGMRIASLGNPNEETTLELLEVTDPSSPIINDPPGLHHLGLKVKNIEDTYEMMNNDAQYSIQGEIRQGAHSKIFFFKIKGQEKILFECVQE
jgi:hypothetical protein